MLKKFLLILAIILVVLLLSPHKLSAICYPTFSLDTLGNLVLQDKYNCVYMFNYANNIANVVYYSALKSGYISLLGGKLGFFAGLNKATLIGIAQYLSIYIR